MLYDLIVAAVIAWLASFPDAPYILTDFLHLGSMGDIVPGWHDVLMLYWFAWTGLILGIVSLYLMQEIVTRGLGTAAGWVFVVVAAGFGSFGIYLGRFLRWNSWDLVRRPGPLADELLGRVTDPPRSRACSASRCCSRCCSSSSTWPCTSSPSSPSRRPAASGADGPLALAAPRRRAYTPAMTPGNIPRLIETLKAHAGDDKHIACEDAFRIARDLDVPLADVGRTCNELGIKVMQCQLGCF